MRTRCVRAAAGLQRRPKASKFSPQPVLGTQLCTSLHIYFVFYWFVCTQRCLRAGSVGQAVPDGQTDISPKCPRIRAAVDSAGLQMTDVDYKEQIHFKAWFACHRLCFISFLYSSQLDSVIQRSRIYLCLHFWLGFQVFFPPAIDKGKHVFRLDFGNKDGKSSL